jgi:endonuclease/exonuclease/phosphatase family metal-dependent hydrolase
VVGHLIPYHAAHDGPNWKKHLQEVEAAATSWGGWRTSSRFAGHRLLVGGDFNMTLHDGPGYGHHEGRSRVRKAVDDCALRCVTAVDIRGRGFERDNVDHLLVDADVAVLGEVSFWAGRASDGPMSDHNGAIARLGL